MSEYQYYEFQAIDRPLTREQTSKLRTLSTRATITTNSLSNTYHYGDFGGNSRKLMEEYFDAHVYVSNFGTVTFMLRLSRGVLPEDTLTPYAIPDTLDWWDTEEHTILEWQLNTEEPPEEWVEGEGWMAQLLPIRDELVRGDYRSLYIGWLSFIANESSGRAGGDWEDDENEGEDNETSRTEPPVPPGLESLTGAQSALAQFLGVDIDLLAAAAEASPRIPELPAKGSSDEKGDEQIDLWSAQLPESEIRALVRRIIHGEGQRIQNELQSRYYRFRRESKPRSPADSRQERRTSVELVTLAAKIGHERQQREAKEKQRKRHAHLASLVPRFPDLWAKVGALAEEQSGSAYDKACSLLVDMHAAYEQVNRRPDFDAEFARFLGPNSRRAALVRRLREARLVP